MPLFKIAKSSKLEKIKNNSYSEDKLYIYKESNNIGRLFYDFDDNTRIEIGALDDIYKLEGNYSDDIITINYNLLMKYNSNNSFTPANISNIKLNSFAINGQSIYNIRNINRDTNEITLRKIFSQQNLEWNDYYE